MPDPTDNLPLPGARLRAFGFDPDLVDERLLCAALERIRDRLAESANPRLSAVEFDAWVYGDEELIWIAIPARVPNAVLALCNATFAAIEGFARLLGPFIRAGEVVSVTAEGNGADPFALYESDEPSVVDVPAPRADDPASFIEAPLQGGEQSKHPAGLFEGRPDIAASPPPRRTRRSRPRHAAASAGDQLEMDI